MLLQIRIVLQSLCLGVHVLGLFLSRFLEIQEQQEMVQEVTGDRQRTHVLAEVGGQHQQVNRVFTTLLLVLLDEDELVEIYVE